MRRKRIIAMLKRSTRVVPALLFSLAAVILIVSMLNAMKTTVHDGFSQATVIVIVELLVLVLGTLVILGHIWRASQENRRKGLRNAFANSSSGYGIAGLDGRFIEINPAFCEIVGYSAHELKQMTFQEITHPDDLETDLAEVQDLIDNRRSSYRLKKRYLHKDGSIVWIDLRVAMVRDKQDRPLYMIGQIDKATPPEALPQKVYPYDHNDLLFRWPSQMMPLLAPA
jgi:PAS domain S-box-containing protein